MLTFTISPCYLINNLVDWRFAVSEALRKMYGIRHNLDSLPPMPLHGDTWSVMNSWVLPTRSFLEFVMFSRWGKKGDLVFLLAYLSKKKYICLLMLTSTMVKWSFLQHHLDACRMFVDALDAGIYDEHHESGRCYLSLSKVAPWNHFIYLSLIFIVYISHFCYSEELSGPESKWICSLHYLSRFRILFVYQLLHDLYCSSDHSAVLKCPRFLGILLGILS